MQRLDSSIEAASLKFEEATDFSMKQYENYVMGAGTKEAIVAALACKGAGQSGTEHRDCGQSGL
jgi:hypothetical protein